MNHSITVHVNIYIYFVLYIRVNYQKTDIYIGQTTIKTATLSHLTTNYLNVKLILNLYFTYLTKVVKYFFILICKRFTNQL